MKTTAASLLDLVFEGHQITAYLENGKTRFNRNEIAAALDIKHVRTSINLHLDPDELGVRKVTVRSANGTVQTRDVATLSESGVMALVCSSKKPAARRFRRWLTDEVFPQLFTYGSYLPGATPSERLAALNRRVTQERAACVTASEATLTDSGLMTLRAFRTEHAIPAQDILPIARRLQHLAKQDGTAPVKLTLPGHHNPANAWPRPLLAAAVNSTQPRLF